MVQAQETTSNNLVETVRVRVPSASSLPQNPKEPRLSDRTCRSAQKQLLKQNRDNLGRSAAPSRLMYYRNGLWLDFSQEVVEALRPAFLERKPVVDVLIDRSKYRFDLLRMLHINSETGSQGSISWIDGNGKCFFPKMFISEDEYAKSENHSLDNPINNVNNKPNINVEVKVDGASVKRKIEDPEACSSNKSDDVIVNKRQWLTEACRWPNTRLLSEAEGVYLLARDYFFSGIKTIDAGATITSVYQCTREGHMESARFQVFQTQIELTKASRGAANMVYAWHGTSAQGVESIFAHGFGLPIKVPESDVYGIGVYLSHAGLPQLSAELAEADDNGEKHLILCRVILGNIEKVVAGSGQCHPSSLDFDTGSDDPKNPKWYVVWSTNMNRHILPECVLSYKPSAPVEVDHQLRVATGGNCSVEQLFSKIKSSLSPAKVREILNLYRTFKDGLLAKDAFVRQLRLAAGDEMLQNALQQIYTSG